MTQASPDTRELMRQNLQKSFTLRAMVDSGAPVLAFAIVVPFTSVFVASMVALGIGLALVVERLWRRQSLQQAISGLFGLGIAVLFANLVGQAKGFYLPGIIESLAFSVVLAISLIVQRPLVGVFVGFIDERCVGWRERPALRRAFIRTTAAAAVYYGIKGTVGAILYATDHSNALAGARLALGLPPLLLLFAFGVTQVRTALALDNPEPLLVGSTEGSP